MQSLLRSSADWNSANSRIDIFIPVRSHVSHVMSEAHPTVEPEQTATDTWIVVDPATGLGPNMEIVARVEVPRFSQPTADGVRLDRDKRLSLAVARAIERDDTIIRKGDGNDVPVDEMVNWSFGVLTCMDADVEYVQYEQNPSFKGIWNPEGDA